VPIATRQPPSTPPTTLPTGVRAPSKNVSLNSECPVIYDRPDLDARLLHRHQQ
jgi:hypothetical protein